MSALELSWLKGGEGKLVESDGNFAKISSSIPSPPGSTLEGNVDGTHGVFAVKVKNCKKRGSSIHNFPEEFSLATTPTAEEGSRAARNGPRLAAPTAFPRMVPSDIPLSAELPRVPAS